jgi:hypothetical protein
MNLTVIQRRLDVVITIQVLKRPTSRQKKRGEIRLSTDTRLLRIIGGREQTMTAQCESNEMLLTPTLTLWHRYNQSNRFWTASPVQYKDVVLDVDRWRLAIGCMM